VISDTQRSTFAELGYLKVENALPLELVSELLGLIDGIYARHAAADFDPYTGRAFNSHRPFFYPNILKDDQRFVNLLDWHKTFPLVWGLLGWNIYSYHSHFIVTPPRLPDDERTSRFGFHRDSGRVNVELESSPMPRLSLKVSYWLSDCSTPDRGNLFVIPGSHLHNAIDLPEDGSAPQDAVAICCDPGDAVLFDRRLWHSASPNNSDVTRKAIFIGYGYRWLRPKDDMTIPEAVLTRNDPIRRQLLGDDTNANGKFSPQHDAVPLRNWLEQQQLI
jgi:hypothetical protein